VSFNSQGEKGEQYYSDYKPKLHKGQTEHYGFILRLINLIMSLCVRAQQQP